MNKFFPETHAVISLSTRKAPHTRHVATITSAFRPDGLQTQIAICACGCLLHWFDQVDDTSYHYTDGTTYMVDCPKCKACGQQKDN